MQRLCDLSAEELQKILRVQPFQVRQIFEWVYQKRALSFDQMSSLSLPLRAKMKELLTYPSLKRVREQQSSDNQTCKTLWRLQDGALIESVLIEAPGRLTLCVSSQVGCPARCAFCASGKEGLKRNLTAAEIIEQVIMSGKEVTHIVFMGMGEPLENYDEVVKAIRLLILQMGFSKRRITLSTVGVVEGITRLKEEDLGINLVLSLHAPNQHIRKKIIPYARKYELEDVLRAVDAYVEKTKRNPTFEYTLIASINDQEEHAEELAALLAARQCTVNLIPYNLVAGVRLQKPSSASVRQFQKILEDRGISTTCRYTKGDDIAAACGQLVLQK